MDYTQLRDANWKIPYTGGWCLAYVQNAFGTDHPYDDAVSSTGPGKVGAWDSNYGNGNHPGELPPAGVTVPVYFSLGSTPAGHVAIALSDGTVASSSQAGSHPIGFIYPNLQSLIDDYAKYNGGCTFLGWSKYVGTVQVVRQEQATTQPSQGGEDMIDQGTLTQLFQLTLGRDPDADAVAHYVGHYSTSFVVADLLASGEHAQHAANLAAQTSSLQSQITDLKTQLSTEQTKDAGLATNLADVNGKLDAANKTIADKDAALADDETKIADLSTQLSTLKAQADKPEPTNPTGQVAPTTTQTPPKVSASKQTFIEWLVSLFKVGK